MKRYITAILLALLVAPPSVSAQMQPQRFDCKDNELRDFSFGLGFDAIDDGKAIFDTRLRYCFAEALIRTIDTLYLKRVPRVKPEKIAWLDAEYHSNDYNRKKGAFFDKDFQRWRYYLFFDTLKHRLQVVQNTQKYSMPEWEISNWLWVLDAFNNSDYPEAERAMYDAGYLPEPAIGEPIKAFEFRLSLKAFERIIIRQILIVGMQSGDITVLGRSAKAK